MSETSILPPALPEHATADPAQLAAEAQVPDASAALTEQQTAELRQVAGAEHFNDLPDSVKAEMKATGDAMEPGFMKLRRAKVEAEQRLTASAAYHGQELDNDSHRTGQRAHDDALAAAQREIPGRVETAFNDAVQPGMSEQTQALLRQGLQSRFEQEAAANATAAGEAAHAARVNHVNENGGPEALDRIRTSEENERYMRNVLGNEEFDRRRAVRAEQERAAAASATEVPVAPESSTHDDHEDPFARADRLDAERAARIGRDEDAANAAHEGAHPIPESRGPFDPTVMLTPQEVRELPDAEFLEYLLAHQAALSGESPSEGSVVTDPEDTPWRPEPEEGSEEGSERTGSSTESEPEENGYEWEPVPSGDAGNSGNDHRGDSGDGRHDESGTDEYPDSDSSEGEDGEEPAPEEIAEREHQERVAQEKKLLLERSELDGVDLSKMSNRRRRKLLDKLVAEMGELEDEDRRAASFDALEQIIDDSLSAKQQADYYKKSKGNWDPEYVKEHIDAAEADRANWRKRIGDAFLKAGVNLKNWANGYYGNEEKGKRRKIITAGVAGTLALAGVIWGSAELFGGHGGGGNTAGDLGLGAGGGGSSNPGDKAAVLDNFTPAQGAGGGGAGTSGVETMALGHFDASNPNGDGTVSGLALKALHERGVANPTAAQIHNASNIIANANGYAGDSYTNDAMRSLAEGQTFDIPQDLGQ